MGPRAQGRHVGDWVGWDLRAQSVEDLRAEKRLQVPSDAGSQPTQKRCPHCVLEAGQSLLINLQGQELTPS